MFIETHGGQGIEESAGPLPYESRLGAGQQEDDDRRKPGYDAGSGRVADLRLPTPEPPSGAWVRSYRIANFTEFVTEGGSENCPSAANEHEMDVFPAPARLCGRSTLI